MDHTGLTPDALVETAKRADEVGIGDLILQGVVLIVVLLLVLFPKRHTTNRRVHSREP